MSFLKTIEELNTAYQKYAISMKLIVKEQHKTISLQKEMIAKQDQIITKQQELIESLKITQKM